MGNTRHNECAIRNLAREAKARLQCNRYGEPATAPLPHGVSPAQREICFRLRKLIDSGEEIVNPIAQLADKELMSALSHEERQRYIIRLAADYAAVRDEMRGRSGSSESGAGK